MFRCYSLPRILSHSRFYSSPRNLKSILKEYGPTAFVTYSSISIISCSTLFSALYFGCDPEYIINHLNALANWFPSSSTPSTPPSTTSSPFSSFFARLNQFLDPKTTTIVVLAWSLHQAILPLRIGITALATPIVARIIRNRMVKPCHIPNSWVKDKKTIYGKVHSIGDGDTFKMTHISPWARFLPFKINNDPDNIVTVRIAAVDTPETAHFGNPAQPLSAEAKAFLANLVKDRIVSVKLLKKDQYSRVVGMVHVTKPILGFIPVRYNVSVEVLKSGYGRIYRQGGAEYGGMLDKFEKIEAKVKRRKIGVWAGNAESPAEYKKRMRQVRE